MAYKVDIRITLLIVFLSMLFHYYLPVELHRIREESLNDLKKVREILSQTNNKLAQQNQEILLQKGRDERKINKIKTQYEAKIKELEKDYNDLHQDFESVIKQDQKDFKRFRKIPFGFDEIKEEKQNSKKRPEKNTDNNKKQQSSDENDTKKSYESLFDLAIQLKQKNQELQMRNDNLVSLDNLRRQEIADLRQTKKLKVHADNKPTQINSEVDNSNVLLEAELLVEVLQEEQLRRAEANRLK